MNHSFKILALGDVVGPRAVEYLSKNLWRLRSKVRADLVIANGENSAEPNGIDKVSAKSLFDCGVDVITTGNHVFRKSSVFSYLDDEEYILRPLNFPNECPGHGDAIIKIDGIKILVLNVLGQAYMDVADSPFSAVERALERNEGEYDFCVLAVFAAQTADTGGCTHGVQIRVLVTHNKDLTGLTDEF